MLNKIKIALLALSFAVMSQVSHADIGVKLASSSIAATTTSSRAALPNTNLSYIRVYNAGSEIAFINTGNSSVTATTTNSFVAAGAIETFSISPNDTHLAAITSTGTATVYFQSAAGQ